MHFPPNAPHGMTLLIIERRERRPMVVDLQPTKL
jgi:hypothetical protein